MKVTGHCHCGAIAYQAEVDPSQVRICHCTDCQRMTSSAFSMAVVVANQAFRLTGVEPRLIPRTADSGFVRNRWVCPECGSWICGDPMQGSVVRAVRAGTLDDTSWVRPTVHLWTRSKQPWIALPEGDRSFATQPTDLGGFFGTGGAAAQSG